MSTATTRNTRAPSSTAAGRKLVIVASIAGVIGFLAIAIGWFGVMSGEEFSPDTFERRHFAYVEIPLLHIQIWPITRTPVSDLYQGYLEDEKLLTAPAKLSEKKWDLVHLYRRTTLVREGDAQILCAYLDVYESGTDPVWQKWSKDNPELAKILWPQLAKLARLDYYLFVPDVMDVAKSATEPVAFEKALHETLAKCFEDLGNSEMELRGYARAAQLYEQALQYLPPEVSHRSRVEKALDTALEKIAARRKEQAEKK